MNQFEEKLLAVYSGEDKKLIESFLDSFPRKFNKKLEQLKGKPSTGCKLSEASTNPTEYKSYLILMLKVIETHDK